MAAQLLRSGIPFLIRPFKGNTSDAEQYRAVLPDIFDMVREGSRIIMDNGGAAGDILDSITESGNRYLTRVKLNASDDERMDTEKEKWEYVEDGVCCLKHVFGSSGRTTYVYRSVDNWMRSYHTAERRIDGMISVVRTYEDGKFRVSDFVTLKKNTAAEVDIKVSIQTRFGYDDPNERERMIREAMDSRPGIFKLESSEQLTPSEALNGYRTRSVVEHLMHSLKRVTGIKPLRVWKGSSIKGTMLLALFAEAAISMARYELEPVTVSKMKKGKITKEESRPSTDSMVWSLGQLTVSRVIEHGRRKTAVYSNWNRISREVFLNIRTNKGQRCASAEG